MPKVVCLAVCYLITQKQVGLRILIKNRTKIAYKLWIKKALFLIPIKLKVPVRERVKLRGAAS